MQSVDVVVIGAGLVGAAVAYELRRAGQRVRVCEAEGEAGAGASRSNSGVLHTGFDSTPGHFETRMIRRQAERWPGIFDALRIPYRVPGALVLARREEAPALEELAQGAAVNGVAVELLGREALRRAEPGVAAEAALRVPGEAITDPLEVVARLLADVDLRLRCPVTRVEAHPDGVQVVTAQGTWQARFAVNCAGLFADELTGEFRITPRRGEFLVFERGSAALVRQLLLPLPQAQTKGVLVFPTLHGHLCAGPTAEDQSDKRDWRPRQAALERLRAQAVEVLPALEGVPVVGAWAGLRPVGHPHNYLCQFSERVPALLHLAGIRSTGLSACLGLSAWALEQLRDRGLSPRPARAATVLPPTPAAPWWERLGALRGLPDPLSAASDAAGH